MNGYPDRFVKVVGCCGRQDKAAGCRHSKAYRWSLGVYTIYKGVSDKHGGWVVSRVWAESRWLN